MCSLLVFGSHGRRVGHGRVIPRNQSDLNLTARIPLLLPNYAPPPIPKGLFLPRCGLRRLGFFCVTANPVRKLTLNGSSEEASSGPQCSEFLTKILPPGRREMA